ncbi:major capsid protein [Acidovorax cavernicola]|uniref:Major capsid protein E n=1 Tax=Acidovorax cavernicola TaxID=1675792 RepID=A0A9X8D4L4_9BURK|nr:major capsid protein [Acidovorax cavernicola]RIX79123.1 hypothetical protein D3H34_15395 [Acidovorax cavernicola]
MPQPNLAQARVQDPVLTAVARGYRSPKAKVANVLFPIVSVGKSAGKILVFGTEDFRLVSTVRAPGANTKRVQYGYASGNFALVDHRLEGAVPVENQREAGGEMPGIDLGAMALRRVLNVMALEREVAASKLATDPANYAASNKEALSGTSKWTDPTSDPATDIDDAREAIRSQTGEKPNVLTLGPKPLRALRRHPKILDRMSTAADRPPASIAQLQAILEIETIIEGEAVYHDGASFVDVWGTNAVLAFTTPASAQEMGSPNYGYTYQLQDGPNAEEAYFDENTNTWYYPVSDAYQPVLVGASAGFLFTGAA